MEIPDYKNYSIEDLHDVLFHIDKSRYPDRLKLIEEEIKKRNVGNDSINKQTDTNSTKKPININRNNSNIREDLTLVTYDNCIKKGVSIQDIYKSISEIQFFSIMKYVRLEKSDTNYVQATKGYNGFSIEFRDDNFLEINFSFIQSLSTATIIHILTDYFNNKSEWKETLQWQKLDVNQGISPQSTNYKKLLLYIPFILFFILLRFENEYTSLVIENIKNFVWANNLSFAYFGTIILLYIVYRSKHEYKYIHKLSIRGAIGLIVYTLGAVALTILSVLNFAKVINLGF